MCMRSEQLKSPAQCEQLGQITGTFSHSVFANNQRETVSQLSHLQTVNSRMDGQDATYTQINNAYYQYSIYISVW